MEGRAALWTLVGVVLGFKLIGSLIIFLVSPSSEAVVFLVVMNWPFVLAGVALLVLLAVVCIRYVRLLRARARRADLIRKEWRLD